MNTIIHLHHQELLVGWHAIVQRRKQHSIAKRRERLLTKLQETREVPIPTSIDEAIQHFVFHTGIQLTDNTVISLRRIFSATAIMIKDYCRRNKIPTDQIWPIFHAYMDWYFANEGLGAWGSGMQRLDAFLHFMDIWQEFREGLTGDE